MQPFHKLFCDQYLFHLHISFEVTKVNPQWIYSMHVYSLIFLFDKKICPCLIFWNFFIADHFKFNLKKEAIQWGIFSKHSIQFFIIERFFFFYHQTTKLIIFFNYFFRHLSNWIFQDQLYPPQQYSMECNCNLEYQCN